MKKLNKTVTTLAKIFEVVLWIGTAVMLLFFVLSLVMPDRIAEQITTGNLTVSGFNIEVMDASGNVLHRAVSLMAFAGMIFMPLAAMICRNIGLIFKTAEGKTSFSRGVTPFQKDNVRMVREIGIFSIAMPVLELIFAVIARIVIGNEATEVSVNLVSVFFGLVILCLSQYFAYGMELQEEVDGLV